MSEPFKVSTWTHEDTVDYLRINPLAADFLWKNRDGKIVPVLPTHAPNYGKWLKETPYFPGLFELIHSILFTAPRLPDIDTLTTELRRIHREREGQLKLF